MTPQEQEALKELFNRPDIKAMIDKVNDLGIEIKELKEHCKELKKKRDNEELADIAANQKDIPSEFAEIVNENFWDLTNNDKEI